MTRPDVCRLARSHGMYGLPALTLLIIERTTVGPRAGERVERWRYELTPLPSDWGTAWQLANEESGEAYTVLLDGDRATCDCLGHLRHGFCKHCIALRTLIKRGELR